jgi:hypothetical protein
VDHQMQDLLDLCLKAHCLLRHGTDLFKSSMEMGS